MTTEYVGKNDKPETTRPSDRSPAPLPLSEEELKEIECRLAAAGMEERSLYEHPNLPGAYFLHKKGAPLPPSSTDLKAYYVGENAAQNANFDRHSRRDTLRMLVTIKELQAEVQAERSHNRKHHSQFLEAVAHPENWTKMRANLLMHERSTGLPIGTIYPKREPQPVDSMTQVQQLALNNPAVANAMALFRQHELAYEQALEIAVIALAAQNDELKKQAIERLRTAPQALILSSHNLPPTGKE